MSRDTFLNRVRAAALAGRSYRVHLNEIPAGAGYVGARDADVCAAMAAEVDEVGGTAHLVKSDDELRTQLVELLRQYDARSALCWRHAVLDELRVAETLEESGVEHFSYDSLKDLAADDRREKILAADVGITSADIAIAETGTLVVCSQPGQERISSLVPPLHIAIIRREQIVPDLFDAFERLGARSIDELPSNISLITGPSKTGDIELTLTTGVHGPGRWHVIIRA